MSGLALMSVLVYFGVEPLSHLLYLLAAGILLTAVHIPNIKRLLAGTERRIGEPPQPPSVPKT